jgi:hypothetical protein
MSALRNHRPGAAHLVASRPAPDCGINTVGGYNKAYDLNLRGNRINYEGAVNDAAQARDATIETAKLRAVAAVGSAVGHNIARDME